MRNENWLRRETRATHALLLIILSFQDIGDMLAAGCVVVAGYLGVVEITNEYRDFKARREQKRLNEAIERNRA